MLHRASALFVVAAVMLPVMSLGQQVLDEGLPEVPGQGQVDAPAVPPIQAVEDMQPKAGAFKADGGSKPLIIRSRKDAAEHFAEAAVATLAKQVDFERQTVLVFAWRGSGQDRLTYAVAESYPEQVFFTYQPGRTRDLRPHVHVYALRSNVKWRAPAQPGGRPAKDPDAPVASDRPAAGGAEEPKLGEIVVTTRHGKSVRGTVDGFPFLLLRGTNAERGKAHGRLAAREIVALYDATAGFLNTGAKARGRKDVGWTQALQVLKRYEFPERFKAELTAMLTGIREALPDPADRTLKSLGREISLEDLMLVQAGDIFEMMRCSQFSCWGPLTADGEVIVGRNWDYPPLFPPRFACILAVEPAEEGLSPTLDALWFGMIGAGLATINRDGVYVAGNDAGINEGGLVVAKPQPGALLMRHVMETSRPEQVVEDFNAAIKDHLTLGLLFHFANLPAASQERSAVVEYDPMPNGSGTQVRTVDKTRLPNAMVMTNHRVAGGGTSGGDSGERYRKIRDALLAAGREGKTVGFAEARDIMKQVAKPGPGTTTLYTAVAWPARRRMAIAISPGPGKAATDGRYVVVDWEQMFQAGRD